MINAIEQTRREMYGKLAAMRGKIQINYSIKDMLQGVDVFELALEDYLEELRKALVATNSATVACAQHSAESFIELERMNEIQRKSIRSFHSRLAAMTEERDSAKLHFQALEHAYSELEKRAGTSGQVFGDRVASAKADPYTMGYGSLDKCSNPFPINTVERLHWNDGRMDSARDKVSAVVAKWPEITQ